MTIENQNKTGPEGYLGVLWRVRYIRISKYETFL